MIKGYEHLLVLGANHELIPLYETANKIGLHTIGVDIDPHSIARDRASRFIVHSLRDINGILKIVEGTKLSGVITCFDVALPAIAQIAKVRGLPCALTPDSILTTTNKYAFAEMCREIGLTVPEMAASIRFDEQLRFFENIGVPVIVKPSDSAGSKGVTLVSDKEQLYDAFQLAKKYSFSGNVIAQKYIEGVPLSIDVFRIHGKTVICSITRRKHTGYPAFATTEAFLGDEHSVELRKTIRKDCEKICKRIQWQDGPLNFDVISTPNDLFWIEMNGRLSGNGAPTILRLAYDFDSYEILLRLAVGDDVRGEAYERSMKKSAALKIIGADRSGRFMEVQGLDEIQKDPSFVSYALFMQKDDPVEKYVYAKSKVGYLFLSNPDSATLLNTLEKVSQQVKVIVKQENVH